MNIKLLICLISLIAFGSCKQETKAPVTTTDSAEWIELYNGKDFTGWKAVENDSTWTITDGVMQAHGKRSHLFYVGDQLKDGFKNFELYAQVKTFKLANSGIYFHTEMQGEGWPSKGFEIQVNNSHIGEGDYVEYKKAGSLYGVRNIYQSIVSDSVWYETHALVEGKHVQIWLNGIKTVDYVEPENPIAHGLDSAHILGSGTFALQGHDVLSKMQYKSIRVRRLPDNAGSDVGSAPPMLPWYDSMKVLQERQFAFIDLNPNTMISVDSMITNFYQYGVNVSVVKSPDMASSLDGLSKLVFKGIKVNVKNIKELGSANADYIIGESTNLNEAKSLIASGKINIWSHHGEALTVKNASALIDLAAKNKVCIEIDNESKTPSIDIIKLAKSKGCRFTFARLIPAVRMERSTYIFDAIKGAAMAYKDEWVPKT